MAGLSGRWWVSTDEGVFEATDVTRWTNRAPEAGAFGPVTSDGALLITSTERGVFSSPDGSTWTRLSASGFDRVEKRGSTWIGLSFLGGISSSPDGVTWTVRVPGSSFMPVSVTRAHGLWIVGGANQPSRDGALRTSPDGITWTSLLPAGTGEPSFSTVATDGTTTVVTGSDTLNNRRVVLTSTDGLTWTPRTPFHTSFVASLGFFGGTFYAATQGNGVFTSTTGVTWTAVPGSLNFDHLARSSLGWLGVQRQTGALLASTDGQTWTPWLTRASPPGFFTVTNLSSGDGRFVATLNRVSATSADGLTWDSTPDAGLGPNGRPSFGNGRWLAVGSSSLVTSTDARRWTPVTGAPSNPEGVVFGNGTWVATTALNAVSRSPDGLTWTAVTTPGLMGSPVSNGSLWFSNGLFVRLRDNLSTSTDGTTWTLRVPSGANLTAVAFGAGRWVAIPGCVSFGTQPPAVTSSDGITWSPVSASPALCGDAIAFGSGGFAVLRTGRVAPFQDSVLRLSADGLSWTRTVPVGSPYPTCLESGNGRWVLGSAFGAMFASPGAL